MNKRITPYFIGFFLFVLYTVAVPVETKATTCSDVDPGSVEFTYSNADGKTLTYNFTEVYSCPDCFDEETHTWTLKNEDGYTVFSGYGKTVEVFFEEEGEYTMTLTASYSFTTQDGNGDDFTCHSTQEAKQTIKITNHPVLLGVLVSGVISQGESTEYYTITPTPEKISDNFYVYANGASVTLTAVPDEENNFTEWVVASDTETYSSKENPLAITLNKDVTAVYAYFNKVSNLTLSQGEENPTGDAVTPGGKPFVAEHIQLSLESDASVNISSMKFQFYGTGNFEHIDKAILYRYMGCSTGSGSGSGYGDKANHDSTETHSGVLNEDYLTEIAEAEIASDGSMVFSLSETIEPGNTCYILKYLFKYDGKFGSGFTSSESDGGTCESPTFGATISTEDIVVEDEDFEETTEITGWVTPDVYYYVEYNAKKAIDRAKIVEESTSEVISVWNEPNLCEEEFTTISDEPFTIYIEGGLNIYVFSENYGNRPYIKGQGFCYGNEADKEPYLMNPVRRVYDISKEGKEWFWTPGEEIENSYDNCCLKFAGRIKLIVTNKDNITYKDFKRDILKPLWSSSYWSKKDVTVKYFKRIDSKGASVGVVWIDTRECLEKVEELLPGEPTLTRNGRNLTVQYESE